MKVMVVLCAVVAAVSAMPSVGLVGPSGVIGPSGIVGPSGPVQFSQPAWAFLGHHAHAHIAALNRHRPAVPAHHHNPAVFQPAPAVPTTYGVDASGCVVGPSGKVCPTGNIQFS
ncbi:cuticle protein CP1158-like [Macrobrachium rosenbergii]|uniref:cuticle protein CP1158-like n=1 Tax=Macrobrachium rosenbergii TaxID=79674 RepID=UPI0034D519F4